MKVSFRNRLGETFSDKDVGCPLYAVDESTISKEKAEGRTMIGYWCPESIVVNGVTTVATCPEIIEVEMVRLPPLPPTEPRKPKPVQMPPGFRDLDTCLNCQAKVEPDQTCDSHRGEPEHDELVPSEPTKE